jgi:hypothetical protein
MNAMPSTTAGPDTMNRQFRLASRPVGMPKESDFELVVSPLSAPGDGQFLLRTLYLSVDPYMRRRISGVRSYAEPVSVGQVMVGGTVGEVVQSRHPDWKPHDIAVGFWGWQEHAVSDGRGLRKLDPELAPVSTALGVLGMPGLTAYFGLLDICQPKTGETVFVSGAAGAVGSLAGQISKIKGCRVIGTAGSDTKVNWLLNELGFDGAFNYKTVTDYDSTLRELCPAGVDCYFDNVGGPITDAVLQALNTKGRIAICGQISDYNRENPEAGPRPFGCLLWKQARAEGFLVFQFADRYAEGTSQMAKWLHEGKLKYREEIVDGFENTPRAFIGLFTGENTGKMLVRV